MIVIFKFIISVLGSHCDNSPQAPKHLATLLYRHSATTHLQQVDHACHLRVDKHSVALLLQPLQQSV
jgi:hypothetical protein